MASDGAASRVSSGFSVCVRYPPPPACALGRPQTRRDPNVLLTSVTPPPTPSIVFPSPPPPSRSESMTLRDEATGECLWRADPFPRDWREREIPAILPARVLRSDRAVVREVRFVSNASRVDDLTIEQEVVLASRGGGSSKGDAGAVEPPAPGSEPSPPSSSAPSVLLERWTFEYGFVPAGEVQTWTSRVAAATREEEMLDPAVASGRVVVKTAFKDSGEVFDRCECRIFYEG